MKEAIESLMVYAKSIKRWREDISEFLGHIEKCDICKPKFREIRVHSGSEKGKSKLKMKKRLNAFFDHPLNCEKCGTLFSEIDKHIIESGQHETKK